MQNLDRNEKILNTTFEIPKDMARQMRLAAALLGESRSKFVRLAVAERLARLDLPELKILEGAGHDQHRAAA